MDRFIKPVIAIVATALYLLLLRFVAPATEPYFLLATVVVGLVAWLCGSAAGLLTALFLIPATDLIYDQIYNESAISTNYTSFYSSPAYIAVQLIAALVLGRLSKNMNIVARKKNDLDSINKVLQAKLANVQELGGIHSLCSECKSIRKEDGSWQELDDFLIEKTKMEFSHGICPKCAEHFYDKAGEST